LEHALFDRWRGLVVSYGRAEPKNEETLKILLKWGAMDLQRKHDKK